LPDNGPLVIDYRTPGSRRPRRPRSIGEELFKLCLLGTLFVGYGLEGHREKPVDSFFTAGLLLWVVGAATAVKVRASRRPGTSISAGWAWACLTMVVVALAWFPLSLRGYYVCPHGERWANNQVGVARIVSGGPCGNGPRARGSTVWHVKGPWYLFIPMRY